MENVEKLIDRCLHCKGPHIVTSKMCAVQRKEQEVIDCQEMHRVGRRRATQLLGSNCSTFTERPTQKQITHLKCSMSEKNKRKVTPGFLESTLRQRLGSKPKTIRPIGKDAFLIEINDKQQSRELIDIKEINGMPVTMTEYNNNKHKGLIYIYQYDLNEFEEFRSGLMEEYNLHGVVLASWSKPRTTYTKAVLITFKDVNISEYIKIPGEQSRTKVYEYISRPQICSKCLEFCHGAKYCKCLVQLCGKCDNAGHDRANCKNLQVKCHHCSEHHIHYGQQEMPCV